MNIKELLKKVTEIETAIRSAERIASGRSSPGWIPDRGKKQATAAETIEIPESAKPLIKELKKAFPENAGDIDLIITHIMEEISHKPHEIPANIDLTWIDEASNASDDQKEGIRQAYIALLPYARLVYVTEKNGMPEEHAKKLATMLGGKKEVITYLDRYLKLSTNVLTMHDACLFVIPEGEYTLDTWQALSRNNLQDKEFRNLLAQASDIERLAKGMAGQRPDQKKLKEHMDEYSKGWKEYKTIRNERGNSPTKDVL